MGISIRGAAASHALEEPKPKRTKPNLPKFKEIVGTQQTCPSKGKKKKSEAAQPSSKRKSLKSEDKKK